MTQTQEAEERRCDNETRDSPDKDCPGCKHDELSNQCRCFDVHIQTVVLRDPLVNPKLASRGPVAYLVLMHDSIKRFMHCALYPHEAVGKDIIEVVSPKEVDSLRYVAEFYQPNSYLRVSKRQGPDVDLVSDMGRLPPGMCAHVMIACEVLCFEESWNNALATLVKLTVETLFLTCRGPGTAAEHPPDHQRFMPHDLERALSALGMHVCVCMPDPEIDGVFIKAVKPGFINVMAPPPLLN